MDRRSVFALTLPFALCGCGILTPSHTVNFRLRMSLMIANRPVEASTVFSIKWVDQAFLAGFDAMGKWEGQRYGDAIVFKTAADSLIVGLWERVPGVSGGFVAGNREIFSLLPDPRLSSAANYNSGEVFEALHGSQRQTILRETDRPILVRFRDSRDLTTAELITEHNITELYGAGSTVGDARLEVTDAPVSRGIANRIQFWEALGKVGLDQRLSVSQQPFYKRLTKFNFEIDLVG
jgi:hypothetical protein